MQELALAGLAGVCLVSSSKLPLRLLCPVYGHVSLAQNEHPKAHKFLSMGKEATLGTFHLKTKRMTFFFPHENSSTKPFSMISGIG